MEGSKLMRRKIIFMMTFHENGSFKVHIGRARFRVKKHRIRVRFKVKIKAIFRIFVRFMVRTRIRVRVFAA